jgi:hypothetical protein
MGEEGEIWNEVKRQRREYLDKVVPDRIKDIESLRRKGYKVRMITPYQFRINDALDLFPTHQRFHNLRTQKRGSYKNIIKITQIQL